jgi:hypothetical protein
MTEKFINDSVQGGNDRGTSSIPGTEILRYQLPELFKQYNIQSMFDAGCQDCEWAHLLSEFVEYHGGEIDPKLVDVAKSKHSNLDVVKFNILTDQFPYVDLLFVRDVTIHFSNDEKKMFLKNFKNSNIPWLLITHLPEALFNTNIVPDILIQTTITNWCLPPWNWPAPQANAWEFGAYGRSMSLWHQDQIQDLI